MTQGMVISKGIDERTMDNRGSKSELILPFPDMYRSMYRNGVEWVVSTVKEQRADASSEIANILVRCALVTMKVAPGIN